MRPVADLTDVPCSPLG